MTRSDNQLTVASRHLGRLLAALSLLSALLAGCSHDDDDCWVEGDWQGYQPTQLQVSRAGPHTLVMWTLHEAYVGDQSHTLVEVGDDGDVTVLDQDTADLGWWDLIPGGPGHLLLMKDQDRDLLVGQRLDPTGSPVGVPIDIGPCKNGYEESSFFDGESFWIAWTTEQSSYVYQVMLARVGTDGDVEWTVELASGDVPTVSSAPVGDRVWVVWSSDIGIMGAPVSVDGEVGPTQQLTDDRAIAPTLASRGDDALLLGQAMQPDDVLFGRRLGPDGPIGDQFHLGLHSKVPDVLENRPDVVDLYPLAGEAGYLMLAQIGSYIFPCDECELQVYRFKPNGKPVSNSPVARQVAKNGASFLNGADLQLAYTVNSVDPHVGPVPETADSFLRFRTLPIEGDFDPAVQLDHTEWTFEGGCTQDYY